MAVDERVRRMVFAVEDALFESVAYRPWLSPLGTARHGVDHGDRRVIGRLDGEAISVTDLPPHIVHHRDPPGYVHTHQYFGIARDFYDWVRHTAAATRLIGPAHDWDTATKRAIAARAVYFGLRWDADGNIIVKPPAGYPWPHGTPKTRIYSLRPGEAGADWDVVDPVCDPPVPLDDEVRSAVLNKSLRDVCCGTDPLSFEIEIDPRLD